MSNIFSTVPIFRGLRPEGTTFYTFSSAVNDTVLLFSNSNNIRMNFSKFACIKLPNWENVAKQRLYRNPLELESVNDTNAVDDANQFFVKAYLQNYVENFCSYIDANRQDLTFSNFAEAAFWKSLQSVSQDPNTPDNEYLALQLLEASTYLDVNNVTRKKFAERPDADNEYAQIVQYVGDINMLNHVKSNGKEYLEVYGHIPTGSGRMTDILFKENLGLDANLAQVPATSGTDWVNGQEDNYLNAPASAKTYAKAVYDTADKKYNVNIEKDFLQIDWDDIESDEAKATKWDKGNFDFNAVLLYYDIFSIDEPTTRKRNLYGILLLDKFTQVSPTTEAISTYKKYQPDANQAGNGFGFRFNLMFSNSTNQLTSEITINDYSTISMELYMKALERLQVVTDSYDKMRAQLTLQAQQHEQMRQIILSLQLGQATQTNVVVNNGQLLIFKTSGIGTQLATGDFVQGIAEGFFIQALYNGGPVDQLSSYNIINQITLNP
jgi:hypothetical protein